MANVTGQSGFELDIEVDRVRYDHKYAKLEYMGRVKEASRAMERKTVKAHHLSVNISRHPKAYHNACCDCGGWCIPLWIAFGICITCETQHGYYECCDVCGIPPTPGKTCP